MLRPPISISHECMLSLIHPVAGSKWFGTIQGMMLGHDLVAPVGEERLRLEEFGS